MTKISIFFLFVGVAAANYGAPAGGGLVYNDNYYSSEEDHYKKDIRKLSQLDGTGIFKADVKYYHNKNGDYALISCKPNPIPNHITWILANTDENIHGYRGVLPADTLPLAGGINITFMAKYGRDGKWRGDDILYSEERKFRRVGCLHSQDEEMFVERIR